MSKTPRLAALAALALLFLSPVPASAWDPSLRWYSLETPHFVVSYHEGLGQLAQKAARALEAAHERLVPALGHAPKERVQVVVTDETDSANGSATAFLRPEIHLLAVPPDSRSELNDYEDYLWNLVTHEYTHVLHLDEIGGFPALVNSLVGQLWIPNNVQPHWFIEGLAVYEESALSGSGRERSSLYDMYLRAEVLDGTFFELDDASGYPTRWPRGAVPYLHGAKLLEYVANRFGPEAFRRISRDYGSQAIPLAINRTARAQLGKSWLELHEDWKEQLFDEVEQLSERLSARGLTEARLVSHSGDTTGEPHYLPDGRLLYLEDNGDRRANLRLFDPQKGAVEPFLELTGSGPFALAPDGKSAVISAIFNWSLFYDYEDLYRLDLKSGSMTRLTGGARATEPDVGQDGKTIVAARRIGGGRTALMRIDESGQRDLYQAPRDHVVFTPRLSPDGKAVAFSEQRPEGRDIRLLDLASGEVRDLTRDRALDLDPAFDPSGRWLLFASDRSGIYNLYAKDLQGGETYQVTNVLTGAFKPAVSPDSKELAFVTYSSRGYDVAVMPFEPERWRLAPTQDLERPKPEAWESTALYPTHDYQPWKTLLPRYWLPSFGADPRGAALGLVTGGSDVAGHYDWSLSAGLGLESLQPYFDLSVGENITYPLLSAGASSWLASIPGGPQGAIERQSTLSLWASFPYSWRDLSFGATLGYELRRYDPFPWAQTIEPDGPVPFIPEQGLASTAIVGLSFSNAQRFANAISAERGQSLSLTLRATRPELGGDFSATSIEAVFAKYLLMPWAEHHALALRLAGATGVGDLGQRRLFSLGGIGIRDPLIDALNLRTSTGVALRGYKPGAFAGNSYVLGNFEYRFPLWLQGFGPWTFPLYLRRLSGALFCDVGEAANTLTAKKLRPSVGGELRDEIFLGYGLLTNVRLGFARGLGEGGISEWYLALGGAF